MKDRPNITFYANSLKDAPLGARVTFSDHIKNNHGLVSVSGDNNLCFFQCLAVHRGGNKRWNERDAQKLFNDYYMHFNTVHNAFTGVNLSDFVDLEDFFKIIMVAYELEEGVAKLIQRSRKLCSETMRLSIWENHLSPIVDFEHYCSVYHCIHCGKLWDRNSDYCRHTKTFKTAVRELFPEDIYKIHHPYLKNWKKLMLRPKNNRFIFIIVITILRLIFPKKIFLKMILN